MSVKDWLAACWSFLNRVSVELARMHPEQALPVLGFDPVRCRRDDECTVVSADDGAQDVDRCRQARVKARRVSREDRDLVDEVPRRVVGVDKAYPHPAREVLADPRDCFAAEVGVFGSHESIVPICLRGGNSAEATA